MNKEQFKGSWQEFKGEMKKQWGKFTDNDLLEAEGDYDKFLRRRAKTLWRPKGRSRKMGRGLA